MGGPGSPVARFRGPPGGRFGVARAPGNHRFTEVKRRFRPFGRSRCFWAPEQKKRVARAMLFRRSGLFGLPGTSLARPADSQISPFSRRASKKGGSGNRGRLGASRGVRAPCSTGPEGFAPLVRGSPPHRPVSVSCSQLEITRPPFGRPFAFFFATQHLNQSSDPQKIILWGALSGNLDVLAFMIAPVGAPKAHFAIILEQFPIQF